MSRVVIISQARMGSTRMPAKVLKTIQGRSLLDYQAARLKRSRSADAICFAIPDTAENDVLYDVAKALGVDVCRGSERNVLSRYAACARTMKADIVVRVTSDCPFIAPELIDRTVEAFRRSPAADYAYMDLSSCARGFDTEVFSSAVLYQAADKAKTPHELEHVTPFIYAQPVMFTLLAVQSGVSSLDGGRFCVDTKEDFALAAALIEHFGNQIDMQSADSLMRFVESRPALMALNANVAQKMA